MNSEFLETEKKLKYNKQTSISRQAHNLIPRPLRIIFKSFSPAWFVCIPLAAVIVVVWNTAVTAQGLEPPSNTQELTVILNTVFLLFCSILVIFMNAGFAMVEAGFCRQKNAVNILAKNLIVFAIATLAYWAIGYGLMYGEGNPFIGLNGFFFSGDPAAYGNSAYPEAVPEAISFLFQVAFAATAATIVSGAVAERVHFGAFLIFSTLLVAFSYAITGHWIWDGGWLSEMGFRDFAGSTVVHSVGGWAALVGAALLGPRLGRYQNGRIGAIPGHNMGFATLGCLILWIGWFGFNPGSELAATGNIAYIALTTNLSGAAGGVAATTTSWLKDGKPDLSMIINGILAGLVGITAGCADVSYLSAIIIGLIAGVLVVFSVGFFDRLKIDDPVGATSVHLVCGIWGTLAVGIFSTNPDHNIVTQLIGVLAVAAFTILFSAIVWSILKFTMGIRVNEEDERIGLDISEHGMEAYNGFVKEADILSGSASNMPVSMSSTERSEF
ncbi:ammonium/methylammonium permease [Chondrocystis sp. NIES-4102]|nr:ammonium/methylammonium permease [Chondrocystis sp. NIES-4102]